MALNPLTVLVRQDICATCPHQCSAYLDGKIVFDDPAASCPINWLSAWKATHLNSTLAAQPLTLLERSSEDTIEAGRKAWAWLHREALKGALTVERLNREFHPMIPKYGCGCWKGWREVVAAINFREHDQFAWSVEVHNAVNDKLDKPVVSMDDARAVWEVDSSALA